MVVGPDSHFDEKATEALVRSTALRRFAEPYEQAEMVLWLASDKSSYATGGHFVVDAGVLA
ncbi:3-alpha-(or 20-beta)-hydroxysteroid dehydrogenase [compost metagenome]